MRQQGLKNIKRQAERVVAELGVSVTELRSGGRRGVTAQVEIRDRTEIGRGLRTYIGRGSTTGWHFDVRSVEVVEPEFVNLIHYVRLTASELDNLRLSAQRGRLSVED